MAAVDVTRIAGNIGALNALNSLSYINSQLSLHQTRLATGKQINSAADDPAGMNMAITFDVRRQDMKTVLNSLGDAGNLLSTAEGGLSKISDILVQMKNKAIQAKGSTLGTNERTAIANQLTSYAKEIDDVVSATQWNGNSLLDATAGSAGQTFLSGVAGDGAATKTDFAFSHTTGFDVTGLALPTGGTFAASDLSSANIDATVAKITTAINTIKTGISETGAMSARMTFKTQALTSVYTNTEAAYNQIMNANMADEQVQASKFSILQQTATAELAQANAAPQFLLSLFR